MNPGPAVTRRRSRAPRRYTFLYTLLLFGTLTIVSFGVTYSEVASMAPHLVNVDGAALESALAARVQMCAPHPAGERRHPRALRLPPCCTPA